MAERRQVCRQVQEKVEMGLVVSMGERLFDSTTSHGHGWGNDDDVKIGIVRMR